MKMKRGLLGIVGGVLLSMVTAGVAMASPSPPPPTYTQMGTGNNWIWSGTGNSIVYDLQPISTWLDGNVFSLTNVNGNLSAPVISPSNFASAINVSGSSASGYKASVINFAGSTPVDLGSSSAFKFNFSNGGAPSYSYNLFLMDGTKETYKLSSTDSTMEILFKSTATPSTPTPLPGAALLFGSSLLGLLGIGSRKNKA